MHHSDTSPEKWVGLLFIYFLREIIGIKTHLLEEKIHHRKDFVICFTKSALVKNLSLGSEVCGQPEWAEVLLREPTDSQPRTRAGGQ